VVQGGPDRRSGAQSVRHDQHRDGGYNMSFFTIAATIPEQAQAVVNRFGDASM
jgi:hypothetical protein